MTKLLLPERKLLYYCRLYRPLDGAMPCSVLPPALCSVSFFLLGFQSEGGAFLGGLWGADGA